MLAGVIPNDPLFADQWNLDNHGQTGGTWDADIDAPAAWQITAGSMSTIVAVMDNGVDYTHEDLYLNIYLNQGEIPPWMALSDVDSDGLITLRDLNHPANAPFVSDLNGTGFIDAGDLMADPNWANNEDNDSNNLVDDLSGWDFHDNDNDPMNIFDSHGTAVAGVMGAVGNNGVGIAGINWQVQIMPIRMQADNDHRDVLNAVAGLDYAVAEGATISNNSWLYFDFSQVMYDAIARAGANNHLFVAAAGGQAKDNDAIPTYPACYDLDNIISVTATDDSDTLASFPDWGGNWGLTSVDVSAPSPGYPTTGNGNSYLLFGRVSAATPHVTGVAALLRSLHPDWTAAQIKSQIMSTVDPLPSLAGKTVSGGRVNTASAVGATSIDTVLFSDSFELGQWNGLWVEDSQNDWFTSTQRKTDGSYSAEVDGSASDATLTIASPINLTPYGSAELTFDWLIESGLDTGEYLALDLFNGTSWQEVAKLRGNVDAENVWHSPVLTIDGTYLMSNFQFRFRAKMSGSDEDTNVDNVHLVATSLAGLPNQLPVAVDDAVTAAEDTSATINVLANDSDPDLDVLQVESVTQGSHGAVGNNGDGTLTYTPQANFFGDDSFTYTLGDGRGGTDAAHVLVTISPVNDAPVAVDNQYTTHVDVALNVPAATGVLANDADVENDTLTATLDTGPAHGSLALNPDGSFDYVPDTGFLGADGFIYFVQDGQGGIDTGTVSINVVESMPATLSINDVSKNEGKNGTTYFTFTVTRGGDTSGTVTVNYATANGTATAGVDYYAASGTLSFASGETTKTLNVGVKGDRVAEPNETFFVNLSGALGGEITDSQGLGTILNDDGLALMAAFGEQSGGQTVTLDQIERLVPVAVALWSTGSRAAVPAPLIVELDDLPSGQLGAAFGHTITLDLDANGAGWHTGRTTPAADRVDLLSVLSHEIGHVLGYDHSELADNLMAATLPAGTRRLPELDSIAYVPLLPRETQLNLTQRELVDYPLLVNETDGDTPADIGLRLLVLVSGEYLDEPRISSKSVHACVLDDIVDEKTELLDDELLDLIAAIQQ